MATLTTIENGGTTPNEPLEVFFSYAHKDEVFKNELEKHLAILQRNKVIQGWHDRQISAGTEWKDQIDFHLEKAQIILLLISSDFISSNYCYDVELKKAMERHQTGEAVVIPIILRPCRWQDAPFSKFHALPKNAKPVTSWDDKDAAYTDIVEGLITVTRDLASRRRQEVSPSEHLAAPNLPSPSVEMLQSNRAEPAITFEETAPTEAFPSSTLSISDVIASEASDVSTSPENTEDMAISTGLAGLPESLPAPSQTSAENLPAGSADPENERDQAFGSTALWPPRQRKLFRRTSLTLLLVAILSLVGVWSFKKVGGADNLPPMPSPTVDPSPIPSPTTELNALPEPVSAETWYQRGVEFYRNNKYEDAINFLNAAIDLKPSYTLALQTRGALFIRIGKFDSAEYDFTELIKLNFKAGEARYFRGWARLKSNNFDGAIEDMTYVIINEGGIKASAYLYRGMAYAAKYEANSSEGEDNFNKALLDIKSVLSQIRKNDKETFINALMLKASLYLKRGEDKKAITDWEAILRQYPSEPDVLHKMGAYYYEHSQPKSENAVKAYDLWSKLANYYEKDKKSYCDNLKIVYGNLSLASKRKTDSILQDEGWAKKADELKCDELKSNPSPPPLLPNIPPRP